MFGKNPHDASFGDRSGIENLGSNHFDAIAELLELAASIVRRAFPSVTRQVNEGGRAYRAFHKHVPVIHREGEYVILSIS